MAGINAAEVKDAYLEWLREDLRPDTVYPSELVTPFYDHLNDNIVLRVRSVGDRSFVLSDGGHTLFGLRQCGVGTNNLHIRRMIQRVLKPHGARLAGKEIIRPSGELDLGMSAHSILLALHAVYVAFKLNHPKVRKLSSHS